MTKGKNGVSVIVPVYNVEKYVDQCIRSVVNQTYKNFELILVNDGSKDNSGNICDRWKKQDNRIICLHKKNGGLVSAWTAGLEKTLFEWIVFLDSDDWIEPNHISVLVNEQEKSNADIVVTKMKQVYKDYSEYIDFLLPPGCYSENSLKEIYPRMLNAGGFEKRGIPVSRCSKLIRKSLLLDNLQYCVSTTTFEEDLNIMFPAMLDAKTISLIESDNAAYCYRMVEESMLHGYDKNMQKSIEHVYPAIIKACKDKNKEEFMNQIEVEYLSAMIRNTTNELQNPNGINCIRKNIERISKDAFLREVLSTVDWSNLPKKFVIIAKMLKHFGLFEKYVLTRALIVAKKIK